MSSTRPLVPLVLSVIFYGAWASLECLRTFASYHTSPWVGTKMLVPVLTSSPGPPSANSPLHPSHFLTSDSGHARAGSTSSFLPPHRPLRNKCSCCHPQGLSHQGVAPHHSLPPLLSTHLAPTGAASPTVVPELPLPLYFSASEAPVSSVTCKSTGVLVQSNHNRSTQKPPPPSCWPRLCPRSSAHLVLG